MIIWCQIMLRGGQTDGSRLETFAKRWSGEFYFASFASLPRARVEGAPFPSCLPNFRLSP
jgi:hypothetical protein